MAESRAKQWVGYRPEIRIVDCTIRDGGLMNDHRFTDRVVHAVYQACCLGGIDYMEAGYKGDRRLYQGKKDGKWRFCDEDDLKRMVEAAGEAAGRSKVSVMADVDRTDAAALLPKDQSVITLIRVATYIHQIPAAIELVRRCHDLGYETCLNLMALSTVPLDEVIEALALVAASPADCVYVVDSFGSLYSEQVRYWVELYLAQVGKAGKQVGIHTHNNQQLAFANSIEAIVRGANYIDGSLAGLGRGAGNCPTELLAGFLHNPRYRLRPLISCIQHAVEPLRQEFNWGPDIAYMLSGLYNQHPRAAMEFDEGPHKGDWERFYDLITEA